MILIIQKQEVKFESWKFLPINVVSRRCTQAVQWGCIAPYSHCWEGRGKRKARVAEIVCQDCCASGFDSYFGKGMVEKNRQIYPSHTVQEEFVCLILQAWKDKIKCTLTCGLEDLCSPCSPAVFGVYFVKLWYLYTDSAPTTMMYLPVDSAAGDSWPWFTSKRQEGPWVISFSQWAFLWGLSITGMSNSKAHGTETSAWTAEYIHQLLVKAASAPGLKR